MNAANLFEGNQKIMYNQCFIIEFFLVGMRLLIGPYQIVRILITLVDQEY